MGAICRWTAVGLAALLLWGFGADRAHAQWFCSSDTACGATSTCETWFGPIKRCEFARCNADLDCDLDRVCLNGLCRRTLCNDDNDCERSSCRQGVCRRPAPPATPTPPRGGSGGGEGAACGKQVVNGVTRVFPACGTGFRCQQGRCTRPLQ